jgi:ribosome assembly protein YihI (activator of Der GTPase)
MDTGKVLGLAIAYQKQQAEIDELVDMLEELRKLQEHDDMFSPEELTRIDALIKKHKGE